MLKFFVETLFRRRFGRVTLYKSDDELTRFLKQTTLIKRRTSFETKLNEDLQA